MSSDAITELMIEALSHQKVWGNKEIAEIHDEKLIEQRMMQRKVHLTMLSSSTATLNLMTHGSAKPDLGLHSPGDIKSLTPILVGSLDLGG